MGSRSPVNTTPSTSTSASSGHGGRPGQALGCFRSLPTPVFLSPFLPSSEGSESWDESRLSARARSPSVGKSSNSSRCCRLRCRSRSRSLALRALSSCSSSLCGDPVSHERGLSWAALLHRTSRVRPGPPPPSPGCEAGHGAGGSTWWNGTAPRPLVPAASAAPGSTGAGLSCGQAGGERHGGQPRRGTGSTTPCPAAVPLRPHTCASPARCAATCGRDPGDQHRRHRPPPSTHPSSLPTLT